MPFTWKVYGLPPQGTDPLTWEAFILQQGTGIAAPNADTRFASPTVAGANPAAIFWANGSSLGFGFWVSFSTTSVCSTPVRINPQPGASVNMVSGTGWPGGDPFLQRQNEPSVAFSTRNPDHLLGGANDYRTVDLPNPAVNPDDEEYSGDAWLGLFKSFDGGRTWQSTLLPGYPQDQSAEGLAFKTNVGSFGAAADPIVRAGTSGLLYYAGIGFVRPASGNPTQGALFVARFMDLNNKENGDATQSRDPIRYVGATAAAQTTASAFIDKPAMAVDAPRGAGTCSLSVPQGTGFVSQTVPAGNVYLAYSAITGTGPGLQGTIFFTRSTDCGASWSVPLALSTPAQAVSQGAAMAVDPVSGNVYVAWRQFASGVQSNAINVVKISAGGTSVGPVTSVLALPSFDFGNPAAATFFDQGTTGGSFRTNAYPSLAVDGAGRVYLAWTQRQPLLFGDSRIMLSTSTDGVSWSVPAYVDNNPIADDTGNLFMRGHQFMPQITFNGGRLSVLFYDMRLDHTLGTFTPVATFPSPDALGRFELETRAPCGVAPPAVCSGESPSLVFTPFLTDAGLTLRRHTADLRFAQSAPGASPSFTSTRLSRYNFGTRGDETSELTFLQQLQVNPPNLPMFQLGTVPFVGDYIDVAGLSFVQNPATGAWGFNTAPAKAGAQFAVWTSNQDVVPPVDPATQTADWSLYTPPRSALNAGNGGNSSLFDAGQSVPACESPFTGSRNQNIYGALVSQDFVFSSPQNAKPLSSTLQRAFVVVAQNMTGANKAFRLVIAGQPPGGWASFTPGTNVPLAAPTPKITTLDLAVAAHSSASRSVFVTSSNPTAAITVNVAETAGVGGPLVVNGLDGFVVLNGDPSAPTIVPPDDVPDAGSIGSVEVYMPNVTNPNVTNPNVTNPNVTNPNVTNPNVTNSNVINPNVTNPNVTNPNVTNPNVTNPNVTNTDVANPNVTNPNVTNPNVTNPDLTNPNVTNPNVTNPNVTNPNVTNVNPSDAVYTVTNTGNTTASYQVKLVGTAPPAGVVTQLIITKSYKTLAGQNCQLFEQNHETLVVNVLNPVFTPPGAVLNDPSVLDPGIGNPTIPLKPNESATVTLRAYTDTKSLGTIVSGIVPVVVPQGANTNDPTNKPTAQAAGGTAIVPGTLQILTASLPDGIVGIPYSAIPVASGVSGPPNWTASGLPPGLAINAATGQISGTPLAAGSFPANVAMTAASGSANRDFTVRVTSPLSLPLAALPAGTVGVPYAASLPAAGGLVPIDWSLASGSLPAGLALSAGGAITGAPLSAGTSNFVARAADSSNPAQGGIQSFSITVNNAAPNFLQIGGVSYAIGGQTFVIPAHLQDGVGAPIPGANLSIDFGAKPCAAAVLGGTTTALTNAAGNATFVVSIDRGQRGYTLVANVIGFPGITATTNGFNVEGFCGSVTPMTAARKWHTATRLPNGKVLIAGGHDGTAALSSAELFDPATGAFTATGSMSVARVLHSATLLNDGTVLVVGGGSDFATGTLASAEIYNPGTGLFTPTGSLTGNSRQGHGAVRLNDGRVLVAGGFTIDSGISGLATAELYNPGAGTFSATAGNMTHDRVGDFTTTLLADGRVLFTGGGRNFVGGPVADGELFDPASTTFSAAATPMNSRRGKHTAVLQTNGQVFLAGGEDDITFLSSTEYFDPTTNSFVVSLSTQPVLLTPREAHTATRLMDDRVLEAGGQTIAGVVTSPLATSEIYDPYGAVSVSANAALVGPRQIHTATSLADDTVLLAGGTASPATVLSTAEVFYPAYFTATPAFPGLQISNVQLNLGNKRLVLPGGGSFTLDHDYFIVNDIGCPGCIDQIEVGLANDANYQTCTYDAVPGVVGVSGHGTASLTVPSAPGRYYIGFDDAATYYCGQYPAWWNGPPGGNRYMGVVIVP
ncbi:MAG: kelch repeat-containing protein [Acidobacteriota bacterium]